VRAYSRLVATCQLVAIFRQTHLIVSGDMTYRKVSTTGNYFGLTRIWDLYAAFYLFVMKPELRDLVLGLILAGSAFAVVMVFVGAHRPADFDPCPRTSIPLAAQSQVSASRRGAGGQR
jgi:hypothetical protein